MKRSNTLIVTALMLILLGSSRQAICSDPIRITSYKAPIANIEKAVDRIEAGLNSPTNSERRRAYRDLKDLILSTYSFHALRLHDPSCEEPPPEFEVWVSQVLTLLKDRIGPYMDDIIGNIAPDLELRILGIAGRIGWDHPNYREFATRCLYSKDNSKAIAGARYFSGLGIAGFEFALAALPEANAAERRNLVRIFSMQRVVRELPPGLAEAMADTLLPMLMDKDPKVSGSASYALLYPGLDPERVGPMLVSAIQNSRDYWTRATCAQALRCIPQAEDRFRPALVEFLDDANKDVSQFTLEILANAEDGDSILIASLSNEHYQTRSLALSLLGDGRISTDQLLPYLNKGLTDFCATDTAAMICTNLGQEAVAALPMLNRALGESTNWVSREGLMRAIVSVDPDGDRSLRRLLFDWPTEFRLDEHSRLQMMQFMGSRAAPALPIVEARLSDPRIRNYSTELRIVAGIGPEASHLAPRVARLLLVGPSWSHDLVLDTLIALSPELCDVVDLLEEAAADESRSREMRDKVRQVLSEIDCS